MTMRIIPISALLAGVALLLLGSGLMGTLLAVRSGLEGFSTSVIGLVMSAYFVGFLLGTAIAPKIIRRVGHIRSFAIFAAVGACTGVLHALWVDPWFWGALRILTGVSIVGLYNVIESWLTAQATNESRGGIFAIYMIVNLVALAGGQWLIISADPMGFQLFSIITILVALSLVPVAMTRLSQPDVTTTEPVPFSVIWKLTPVAVVGGFGSGLVMGAFWGIGPLFAQRVGLDNTGVALLMSMTIIGGALLQLPVGRYSDRHDRRRIMGQVAAAAAVVAAATTVLLPIWPASIFPMMLAYGGLAFAIYPLCAAHMSDWLSSEQLIGGSGWLLLLHGGGAALGPTLAGIFIGTVGSGSLPLFFAILLLPVAWYAGQHAERRVNDIMVAEDQSSHFMPMLRTSSVVMELLADPDSPHSTGDTDRIDTRQDDAELAAASSQTSSSHTAAQFDVHATGSASIDDTTTSSRTGQP